MANEGTEVKVGGFSREKKRTVNYFIAILAC